MALTINSEQRALHALNRLAFGPRPGDVESVKRIGPERWIQQQLNPNSIPEPPELVRRVANMRTLHMTPVDLFKEFQVPIIKARKSGKDALRKAQMHSRIVYYEAVEGRIVRAIYGPRQLQEVMTAFWCNHFNIFAGKGLCHIWIGAFEQEAIRPHTMGRFRDLLGATAKHPAMLFYLDNWQNTAPGSPGSHGRFDGINENYGREVMELHTLGVNGGFTQQDVITLAHILTGWGIVTPKLALRLGLVSNPGGGFHPFGRFHEFALRWRERMLANRTFTQYGFFFYPNRHDFSDKVFLGHHIKGGGIAEGEQALDILARSPATANHLSFQLAEYFVADKPPQSLVSRMASRYLETDGNIRDVLEVMFTSAEFWDRNSTGKKFKTPYDYVISAARATGDEVLNVRPLAGTMALLGMPLYGCVMPNGYRNVQEAWLNPDGMMMRLSFATALGAGRLPLRRPMFADFGGESASGKKAQPVAYKAMASWRDAPTKPGQLEVAMGDSLSMNTRGAIENAPPRLRAPLILGSPEFMMR